MYCALCGRPVEARRQLGAGTLVLAVITFGASLIAVPFYRKRCSICKSTAVSLSPPDAASRGERESLLSRVAELEQRLTLVEGELEAAGVDLSRLKAERDFYSQLLENPASRGSSQRQE
jgi:hypothetical protein